jgi:RNA polymerase subunit RPABC4/transcription elongation factor Spt4
MALKPCRDCGREVSGSAGHCPYCGAHSPTLSAGFIKFWTYFLVILFLGFVALVIYLNVADGY